MQHPPFIEVLGDRMSAPLLVDELVKDILHFLDLLGDLFHFPDGFVFAILHHFAVRVVLIHQNISERFPGNGFAGPETVFHPSRHLLPELFNKLLDEHALEAVHQVSFGIPRKIGAIVEQALTYAMFDQKRTVTAEMVLKVKNFEG